VSLASFQLADTGGATLDWDVYANGDLSKAVASGTDSGSAFQTITAGLPTGFASSITITVDDLSSSSVFYLDDIVVSATPNPTV